MLFFYQLWENKLTASKALEPPPSESELVLGPQNVMMVQQPVQSAGATHATTQPQQS